MNEIDPVNGPNGVTRRSFLQMGGAALAVPRLAAASELDPRLREAVSRLEYLTPISRAYILDKGKAGVAGMSPEQQREAGVVPETWSLEVVPDPASNCVVGESLSRERGNALDWQGLMRLASAHAVSFLQVCTCTNGADPFHMTLWEGVPLREIIRLTRPTENVRRVYYQSYHAGDRPPFQSSLAMGQILENPPGQMPVILAYRMNGRLIPPSHGGPTRMIVPGAYGSKCIKWVQRVVLTNEFKANDSDADLNNDPENALKTRARFINAPREAIAEQPFPLTGMAQVGISGLRSVQYCVQRQDGPRPADDPYLSRAEWRDCILLPPPANWGGDLPGGKLPPTAQTDPATGAPLQWPLRYAIVHWAVLVPGLSAGNYDLFCRTVDGNGLAQPMPRPLPRTGFNEIQRVPLVVKS